MIMQKNSILERIMPAYDFHEVHQITVDAPKEVTYAAVKAVTSGEIFFRGTLVAIRKFPAKIMAKPMKLKTDRPIIEEICEKGFTILGEHYGREIVFGVIGQFWKINFGEQVEIKNVQMFCQFNQPLFAKAAGNMYVEQCGEKSHVFTETRIIGTCKKATRRFRPYWFAIRMGSGFIRRSWLKAIKRRAEGT